jgi:hypothetical protein
VPPCAYAGLATTSNASVVRTYANLRISFSPVVPHYDPPPVGG